MTRGKSAALLAALVLSGCAGGQAMSRSGDEPPPANYRDIVKAHVKTAFFDPYSIRDAEISEPLRASLVFDGVTPFPHSGWMVCLRANAKNRFGAYTGVSLSGFLFKGEAIALVVMEPDRGAVAQHCEDARYSPFPELSQGA